MADLNPNAPVYIPSPYFVSLESCYSPLPLPHHPPPLPSSYFLYNQTPYWNSLFHASSLVPYTQHLCYYIPPQTSSTCYYKKEFAYFQIHQPCPARPIPPPVPLPPCGLDQRRASLTLLRDEMVKDMPRDDVVSESQLNQGVKEGVVGRECDKGVKVSKGCFRAGFGSDSFRGKRVYVPKPSWRRGGLPPLLRRRKLTGDYEIKKVDTGAGDSMREAKTTVMIKNLPNKFTTEKLLALLDQHCLHENKKALSLKGEEEASDGVNLGDADEAVTTLSEFDFLYLPIDFRSGSNLGYAFVNFTCSIATRRMYDHLHDFEWKFFGSHKTCEVTYARIQDLKDHFRNSVFFCERDQFLPMCFQPSRNGFNQPEPEYMGRRIHGASQVTVCVQEE